LADDDAKKDHSYDDEIIALLHQVGQRLISSEQDRKSLKVAMDDLAEKADYNERAFLTINDRINKAESAIERRQRAIEKIQKEQMAKVEKAFAMSEKIEEALAQHSRIARRLDKVVQDKARMIRKLDRIEEAVIETQDTVNQKALALLAREESAPPVVARESNENDEMFPWWKKQGTIRAAAVSAMLVIGVTGGWAVSTIQNMKGNVYSSPGLAYSDFSEGQGVPEAELASVPSFEELAAYEEPADLLESEAQSIAVAVDQVLEGESVPAEAGEDEADPEKDITLTDVKEAVEVDSMTESSPVNIIPPRKFPVRKTEEPVYMDEDELVANLDENPDKLASQLNEISPAVAANIIDEIHEETGASDNLHEAAFAAGMVAAEMSTEDFLKAQKGLGPVSTRIERDPDLPPVLKEVENKAFEGNPEAQHDLAAIYTAGHGGIEVNFPKAATWFRESAAGGVANARYNLGVLYHQGMGVEADITMAVKWYQAAADMGHPEAQYNLGIAYIEGIGTRYNPDKAAYYFEQAASKDILEAAYNLGLIYENGLTGTARPDEALYWYKQASDMGSPEAKVAMDKLARTLGLFPDEVDRLYSKRKDDSPDVSKTTVSSQVKPSGSISGQDDQSGVEYIEAQPLEAAPEAGEERSHLSDEIDVPVITSAELPGRESGGQLDHAVVAQIQEQLIRLGLYPGPADGVNDSLTEDAIRAYQTHFSLSQDGRPSQALLVHMMTSELGNPTEFGSSDQ
jgi:localization factor PodJL